MQIGVITMVLSSLLFVKVLHLSVTVGMLLSLTFAFWVIAVCEFSYVKGYFHNSNRRYFDFMQYFKKYWQLGLTNFIYTLALYAHNFVFWTKTDHIVVQKTYICYPPYDMATCIAMLTNISASVILTHRSNCIFMNVIKHTQNLSSVAGFVIL